MTRKTSARVAGVTYLLYIAIGVSQLIMSGPRANGIAAKLTLIAQNVVHERIDILLSMTTGFIAITLGVALYGLTRREDNEIAVLGLACRVGEGLQGVFPLSTLGLLWLATTQAGAESTAATHSIASFLLQLSSWKVSIAALLFAVGSTCFSWLLLRGRMIPIWLAWLGVIASVLLVIVLPLQLTGVARGLVTQLIWIPMAAFEIPLGVWLIVRSSTFRDDIPDEARA